MPTLMTPVQRHEQVTCAAGRPSMITGEAAQSGHGTGTPGPITRKLFDLFALHVKVLPNAA